MQRSTGSPGPKSASPTQKRRKKSDVLDEIDATWSIKKSAKVLHYFSLVARLKRIYASLKVALSMRWHDEEHTKDEMLRYPADSLAQKIFDDRPDFA